MGTVGRIGKQEIQRGFGSKISWNAATSMTAEEIFKTDVKARHLNVGGAWSRLKIISSDGFQ
jgi:hypothetical protein